MIELVYLLGLVGRILPVNIQFLGNPFVLLIKTFMKRKCWLNCRIWKNSIKICQILSKIEEQRLFHVQKWHLHKHQFIYRFILFNSEKWRYLEKIRDLEPETSTKKMDATVVETGLNKNFLQRIKPLNPHLSPFEPTWAHIIKTLLLLAPPTLALADTPIADSL